jgi:hypothetical protein
VSSNATTLRGLRENTIYNVRVQAIGGSAGGTGSGGGVGSGAFIDSMFSPEMTAVTGIGADGEVATNLQTWLTGLQSLFENTATLVPQLETTVLDTTDRRRLLGSGVRRFGFIEKVAEVSAEFPQFWPAFAEAGDELRERVAEINVLRNLLVWFRYASRIVGDLLLIAGDDAFRIAGSYYATVRDSSRRKVPEARQVFQMLQLLWQNRRRSNGTTEEPTEKEIMRNFRALMRGTREGEMFIGNESGCVSKGKRTVIDKTRKKPRNGFKEIETGSAEFGDGGDELSADYADDRR